MHTRRALKQLLWRAAPAVYRRAQGRSRVEFSIGIMMGTSPFNLTFSNRIRNPVLDRYDITDVPATTVADPFMYRDAGRWYLFFEVLNHVPRKGEIGVAVSQDAIIWEYRHIVLAEPFHLSYPYVFEWEGERYMIPESSRAGSVILYRAVDFPDRWERVATLLVGRRYVDSSIFRHQGLWWLFTEAGADPTHPVLRLYYAHNLFGPWQEHKLRPLLSRQPHITRPAGRVIVMDGTPVRFAQEVYPIYGRKVNAFRITTLTPTDYVEEPASERAVITAGDAAWNSDGMHHVDAHEQPDGSWIACVDGFRLREPAVAATPVPV